MLYLFQTSFIQKFCRTGDVAEIQRLIDIYGSNSVITARCCRPDLKTCLHMAAEGGHVDMITLLLDAGADPDKMTRFRFTALHYAVKKNHTKAVSLLLDRGANAEARSKDDYTGGFIIIVSVFCSILYCLSFVSSRKLILDASASL